MKVGAGTTKYSFEDTVNTSSVTAPRNTYVGCYGYAYATAMFQMEGYLGSSPTIPNHLIRPGSGTTIDVTNVGQVAPGHSTATTITAFTGGVPGQEITLLGNANITIAANNATIKTNTGANVTLAVNRAYKFVYSYGIWYQA